MCYQTDRKNLLLSHHAHSHLVNELHPTGERSPFARIWCKEVSPISVRPKIPINHRPQALVGNSWAEERYSCFAAARLQRWAILLSAYNGHANADGLSRLPLPDTPIEKAEATTILNISQIEAIPITATEIASATRRDRILSKVPHYKISWPKRVETQLKLFQQRQNELTIEGDCVLWGTRVIIPQKNQQRLLKELHRDHPGGSRMKSLARSFIWWPGMDNDIENLAKACKECQQHKHAQPRAPLHPWTWPTKPRQQIHIDFAGPFMGTTFLVIVDAHSKWPKEVLRQQKPSQSSEDFSQDLDSQNKWSPKTDHNLQRKNSRHSYEKTE